jgi:Flp pilus assembly protein TadD
MKGNYISLLMLLVVSNGYASMPLLRKAQLHPFSYREEKSVYDKRIGGNRINTLINVDRKLKQEIQFNHTLAKNKQNIMSKSEVAVVDSMIRGELGKNDTVFLSKHHLLRLKDRRVRSHQQDADDNRKEGFESVWGKVASNSLVENKHLPATIPDDTKEKAKHQRNQILLSWLMTKDHPHVIQQDHRPKIKRAGREKRRKDVLEEYLFVKKELMQYLARFKNSASNVPEEIQEYYVQMNEKISIMLHDALRYYKKQLRLNRPKAKPKLKVAQKKTQRKLRNEFFHAKNLITNGQENRALKVLHNAVRKVPGNLKTRTLLVKLLISTDQLHRANQILALGLKQSPNYIPFIELKARYLLLTHKTEDALDLLESHSPAIKLHPEFYGLAAVANEKLGRSLVAVELYRQLVVTDSKNPKWWLGLGISLEQNNSPIDSIDAYQHALKLGRLNPNVLAYIQSRIERIRRKS